MNPTPIMGSAGLGTSLAGRQGAEKTQQRRPDSRSVEERDEQRRETVRETGGRAAKEVRGQALERPLGEPSLTRAQAREMVEEAAEQITQAPACRLAEVQPVWESRLLPSAYV